MAYWRKYNKQEVRLKVVKILKKEGCVTPGMLAEALNTNTTTTRRLLLEMEVETRVIKRVRIFKGRKYRICVWIKDTWK